MVSINEKYMKMCFKLAEKGGVNTLPNPLVGCVIVKDNKIISKDFHKKIGEFHAERNAILKTDDKLLKGADLYVNLEPCSHFGKTPPCADLIIEKGIKKVVFSNFDPNPKVNGAGYKKLKENGVEVETGVLEKEGAELNRVFFKHIKEKKPYIALKIATTLDSKIADDNYNSKWITNEKSRKEVMKLRSYYQAVLTGSNTVKCDNPKLTSRIKGGVNPVRIIMDRKGSLDLNFNVFKNDGARIIVIDNTNKKYPSHIEKISFRDFNSLFCELYNMGIYSVLTESGRGLNSVLIKENMVDEIYHFIAPKILGGGLDFVSNLNPLNISDSFSVYNLKIKRFGEDILLNYKMYDRI